MYPVSYFETLPREVVPLILENVPCYERKFVIPSVCKNWHLLTEQMHTCTFDAIVKSCLLKYRDESSSAYEHRITEITDFVNKNGLTLISQIKKLNPLIALGGYSCGGGHDDGYSAPFHVNWTPNQKNYQITENGKWGDLRTNLSLQVDRFVGEGNQRVPIYRQISIKSSYAQGCQKAGLVLWKNCNYAKFEEIKPEIVFIGDLLTVNINTCIQRAVKINKKILKHKPLFFKDNIKEASFTCNKIGIIIEVKENDSKHMFKLILQERPESKSMSLLWETEDYVVDDFRIHASTEQVLRWAVISKTTDYVMALWGMKAGKK